MADESPPPPPERPPGLPVWFSAAFAVASIGLVVALAVTPPRLSGDGHEYLYTLESLARHGTPDLRDEDKAAVVGVLAPDHPERLQMERLNYPGFPVAPRDGKLYALHFFAYSLSAVPARSALMAVGIHPRAALQVTNGVWFVAALFVVLYLNRRPVGERLTFAALAAVSPVIWHLRFSGTEVYSWSLATMGLVALGNARFGWSGLLFGASALQNPSVILLGGAAAGAATLAGRWRSAVAAAAGAAVGLLPMAMCLYLFGQPSLIVEGYTDWRLVGWGRTAGLITCLNQGLLPYVPVLLVTVAFGLAGAAGRRAAAPLLVAAAVVGMLLSVQVQKNWNSDGCGLMRYLVWMLPPLAWVAAAGVGGWWRLAVPAAVVGHGLIVAFDPPTEAGYTAHRPIAAWVLARFPHLYDPDHEVFIERGVAPAPTVRDGFTDLPAGFATADGDVTKILVDRRSRDRLAQAYQVSPEYLPRLLADADAERPVYLHPPPGTVRVRP
jgi:hypothetical protein